MLKWALYLLIFFVSANHDSANGIESLEPVHVSKFQNSDRSEWYEKSFFGHTRYDFDISEGKSVLRAVANGTASGLVREISVNLESTPCLAWSWKVERLFKELNERVKSGDDYPARVYVVVSGGVFFWKTKALNYVWSSGQAKGADWPNAFTSNAHMLALRGPKDEINKWYSERRNIREDFHRIFGEDVKEIHAVAIMTDSDQSGGLGTAWYGDLAFYSETVCK